MPTLFQYVNDDQRRVGWDYPVLVQPNILKDPIPIYRRKASSFHQDNNFQTGENGTIRISYSNTCSNIEAAETCIVFEASRLLNITIFHYKQNI